MGSRPARPRLNHLEVRAIVQLHSEGHSANEIARLTKRSVTSVYKALKDNERTGSVAKPAKKHPLKKYFDRNITPRSE